jgi:hypothetical protein
MVLTVLLKAAHMAAVHILVEQAVWYKQLTMPHRNHIVQRIGE